jgi:hypothetical protein
MKKKRVVVDVKSLKIGQLAQSCISQEKELFFAVSVCKILPLVIVGIEVKRLP